ncbi:hypothetical protein BJX70DRAFT_400420 [Aspergillus crustosus]
MLFTRSHIFLLLAAAASAVAQPLSEAEAEADIAPTTPNKRSIQMSASLYGTNCETNDYTWDLPSDDRQCIKFDEGKDMYSVWLSYGNNGNTLSYTDIDCQGVGWVLYDLHGNNCYAPAGGARFKSILVDETSVYLGWIATSCDDDDDDGEGGVDMAWLV